MGAQAALSARAPIAAPSSRKICARRAKAKLSWAARETQPAACPKARAPSFAQAIRLDRPIGPGAGGFCTRAQTAASPGAHFPNEKSKALTPAARSERGIPIARILDALSVGSPPSRGSKPLSPPPPKKKAKNEEHKTRTKNTKKKNKNRQGREAHRVGNAPRRLIRFAFFFFSHAATAGPSTQPLSTQAA